MATDTSGNQKVDFAWGNIPMQPNDDRTDGTPVVKVASNAAQNKQWSGYSVYPSARLNPALGGNHDAVEAGWGGYPDFVEAAGNYIITAVSGNGTTVTYTSQNKLAAGDTVNITGLTASAYNLSGATVATANATSFTVTNVANVGLITGQYGKVQSTTALTGADGAGIGYIKVPNVLGLTTALALDALKDAGYEAANITTASAATNAGHTVTEAARTAGSNIVTITAPSHSQPVGGKVTISDTGNATVNGTWTVLTATTDTFTFAGTATTVLALTSLAGVVAGVEGTIKAQSTAAGASSVSTNATITVTPWATAS